MTFSFPYLNIYFHPGPVPTLETNWLSFATGAEFRAGITQALELARQHRATGWIADDRLLGAVHPRDLQWCHDEFLPGLNRIGLQRFALLESENALNRLTIAAMYARAKLIVTFEVRLFEDIQLARIWASGGE